jgi:16S rRNA (guanine966-N2)-methyltransferase
MIRITGGTHRGRLLQTPKGKNTRPTSDRARQSVFNILRHASWHGGILEDATVLDVFAGTGALGLEALSQGASHAAFIESAPAALQACRQNIETLKEEGRTAVFAFDATHPPARPPHIAARTLVFLDPPYGGNLGAAALAALAEKGWLAENAVCVMEMSKKAPETIPPGFTLKDERAYGIAKILFLVRELFVL